MLASWVVLAGGIGLVIAGVGTSDGSVPDAAAQVASIRTPGPEAGASHVPADELGPQEGMLAYAACMREHDIDMDDPRFDANGTFVGGLGKDSDADVDPKSEAYQAAQEACGSTLAALKPALDPALQAEEIESLLRFAACMRDHGLEFPDPGFDGSKFAGAGSKLDKASPEYLAANEVCSEQLALRTNQTTVGE
jgi:hypothetical protein